MTEHTDVVDAQIEAYRARDLERFLSFYADDVSVVLFDGSAMMANKDVMREQYGRLFADSPDLQVTLANRMTVGDFVVDEEHLTGFRFEGMPTEFAAVAVYQLSGGKIARLLLIS